MGKLVSVVIPVKNRIRELKRAVESVLKQDAKFLLEIIVVDNGSDDDQIPSCHLKITDKRIKFLATGKRGNANTARNMGVAYAKGDYIAFLDSDDEWKPNHLSNCLQVIEIQQVDMIYGNYLINNGEKTWEVKTWEKPTFIPMLKFLFDGGSAQTSTFLMKSYIFNEIKWDEELKRHQDYDLCIQVSEKFKIGFNQSFTVVVNWIIDDRRGIDLSTLKYFINKHNIGVNQLWHNKYFLKILRDKGWMDGETELFVKKEVWRYPMYSSFVDYCEAFSIRNRIKKGRLKIKYIGKLLS